MENRLHIYRSSAGSGKTFTLVKEYLRIVLARPEEYRHVLAITFTNKAAEEMKTRVIEALVDLEAGNASGLRELLEQELPEGTPITENAAKVLKSILHDYPSFAISTIDSFFQRLLRSLAREVHLPLRVEVKLEEDDAIMDVTDRLLKQSDKDPELSAWLQHLMFRKLEEDKGWDIQGDIALIAKELLKERGAAAEVMEREDLRAFSQKLSDEHDAFEKSIRKEAKNVLDKMIRFGIEPGDLAYGKNGVAGYLKKAADGHSPADFKMGSNALKAAKAPEGWLTKEKAKDHSLVDLIGREFYPHLAAIESLIETGWRKYVTDHSLLKTLFLHGIVNDLTRLFAEYRRENNQILISDTAKLLQEVITGDDTPFIYEKTGNRYKFLLIDEFQDTSEVQWMNLLPLVINSLGSGHMSLVVGDAKQSIYRWRGGDLRLILEGIEKHLKPFRELISSTSLATNYRSKKAVVEFNNSIFTNVCDVIATMEGLGDLSTLRLAYGNDVVQRTAEKNGQGGYVEIRFTEKDKTDKDAVEPELQLTYETIQDLLKRGFRYSDITVLVRKKKEGNLVAKYLFDQGIQKVISPDSLLIEGSANVRFLINLFRLLSDPGNAVAKSQVLHHHVCVQGADQVSLHELFEQPAKEKKGTGSKSRNAWGTDSVFRKHLPAEFVDNMAGLAKLPVYEISEQLVRIFGLGASPDAFIQRFQDVVLEFNSRQHASLQSFLQWWDSNEKVREKSVVIPENEDAIRIMTIHRSKGLQFPAVIMPFVGWEILPHPNDIVWLSSNQPPYSTLGKVGIRANKELGDSFFEKDWNTEQTNSIIDNLNLLYVAFTRPEQELYLFAPAQGTTGKKDDKISMANHLLHRTLAAAGMSAQADGVFRNGEKNMQYTPARQHTGSELLGDYPVNRWQDKIRVSSRTRKLTDLLKEKSTDKARYGVLVHELLSTIRTLEDVDDVLEKIAFDGLLPDNERDQLKRIVQEVSQHPDIRPFFQTDWEIRREAEILTPDARTLRPDRTLTKGDQAVIVDFKTGSPDDRHRSQLNEYGTLLTTMGYRSVKKYLVYLQETASVLEVADDVDNMNASS